MLCVIMMQEGSGWVGRVKDRDREGEGGRQDGGFYSPLCFRKGRYENSTLLSEFDLRGKVAAFQW